MSTADAIIQKAIANGAMRPDDAIGFRRNLDYLSRKYGYSVDDFAIVMLKETGTLNPQAGSGCVGLIQFCYGGSLGNFRYGQTRESMRALSATQQTAPGGPIDQYFEGWGLHRNPEKTRGALYATVMCPAHSKDRGPNDPMPADACNVKGQSLDLVQNGVLTRNTLEEGSARFAARFLGAPVGPSSSPLGGVPTETLPRSFSGSDFFKADRESCDQPFFQLEAHEWAGCLMKMLGTIALGGSSIGPPTPGFGTAPVATGAADLSFVGPMNPGGFVMPTTGYFTSPFGMRGSRMHWGVDIANPVGTPIFSAAEGIVTKVVPESAGGAAGNYIQISHGALCTAYLHLSAFRVQVGEQVRQGQLIGLMGSTGRSTGSHLHFEIAPTIAPAASIL